MKTSPAAILSLAILAGIPLPAFAASSVGEVIIDYVTVGNAGNAADTTGYGAVAYEYKIAKNETTIGQYREFLNAAAKSDPYALYNINMGYDSYTAGITRSGFAGSYLYAVLPGIANKPITYVNWFDAARFCNWLHNGQGTGSTETGAYTLNGAMSGIYAVNPGAQTWIPSEDEWYKSAYYDASKGDSGGFWQFPNQSNALKGNTIGVAGAANYWDGDYVGYPGMALTDVGAYGANSDSFYGTNDQGGNVWEWNDAIIGSARGLRGGSWIHNTYGLQSSDRNDNGISPTIENRSIGFRVATVPEPSCVVLTLLAGSVLVIRRSR